MTIAVIPLGFQYEATITLGAAIVTATLAVLGLVSLVWGGRKWRSAYEAELALRHQAEAALEAERKEKQGMSDRLAKLDGIVQELAGPKVMAELQIHREEAIQRTQEAVAQIAKLFDGVLEGQAAIVTGVENHEARAAERFAKAEERSEKRDTQIAEVLEAISQKITRT